MTKICTDIEQSKKLIELGIPKNTADMRIGNYVGKSGKVDGTNVHYYTKEESFGAPEIIPAWSLSALLELILKANGKKTFYSDENPLDDAFETVCWLKENNKL